MQRTTGSALPKLASHRQLPRLLWVSGIGALLLVALLLAALLLHLRRTELENARRELSTLATAVTGLIDRYIDTHRVALDAAASLAANYGADPDTTSAAVSALRIDAPALRALDYLDPAGRAIGSTETAPALSARTLARREQLLADDQPALEPPAKDAQGRWSLRLVLPVDDARIGWIVGALDMDALDALLAQIDLGADGTALMLHEAGRLVARQRESQRYRDADYSGLEVFTRQAGEARGGGLMRGRMDRVLRMIAFERLPTYDLLVAVGRSERDILAGWWRIVYASIVGLVLVAAVTLLAIALILRAWRSALAAVNELRIKEERLSEVQRIGELGLWEYDTASDRLLWSDELQRLLDLDEHARNQGYEALLARVHPDDRERVDRQVREAQRDRRPLDLPLRIVKNDGRLRHLRLRARARNNTLGAAVVTGTLLDVTEATLAQERLGLAEAQYRYLFELSPTPLWVFDLDSLRFLAVNEATVDLYGWSPTEFADMTLRDIRPKDDDGAGLEGTLDDPETENGLIWPHTTSDGRLLYARVYSTPVNFQGREARLVASIDFTDKVRAEAELADSEARFRLVARVSNDAIYDFDTGHGSVWWSDSYYHHFGADSEQDDSDIDTWAERIHAEDRARVTASLDQALADSVDEWQENYRFLRSDGGYAEVHDRGFILRDDNGNSVRMVGGMVDRSPELAAQRALAERENSYRGLVERLPLPLLVLRDGAVAFANPSATAALQHDPGMPVVGRSAAAIFDPVTLAGLRQPGALSASRPVKVRRGDGSEFLADLAVANYRDGNGDGLQIVLRDLTEQVRFEQILTHQAQHDDLTGLPNRRAIKDRLHTWLSQAADQGGELATIFVDLDQFKVINDALGHAIGDNVIRTIAERIQTAIGAGVNLARFGGDEFMILADADATDSVIHHVQEAVALPIEVMGTTQYLSASIGVAIAPRDGADPDTLIRSADAAMYEAKRQGRNRAVMYSDVLHRTASNRLELVSRLRGTDLHRELTLYYQTQHFAVSGEISGMELLLRWPRGPQGLRQPSRFIPICEDTGLMVTIGRWVLHEACRRQADAAAIAGRPCRIAVNVSAQQFVHDDLVAEVGAILAETGADGRLLELEITESVILADPGGVVRTIEGLRELGVEVAIDDFGSGYSNLGYLSRLPVSKLKIDRAFVRDVLVDRQHEAICESIINLAHSLSLRVVAEGVETVAQRDWLIAHGCDELQGYLYSHPRAFHDCEHASDLTSS